MEVARSRVVEVCACFVFFGGPTGRLFSSWGARPAAARGLGVLGEGEGGMVMFGFVRVKWCVR